MEIEQAQMIAIAGLSFIAGDEEQLSRFIALTGLAPADLAKAGDDNGMLSGILDFFLSHEPTLLQFAQAQELKPEEILKARQILGGSDGMEW